MRHEIVILAAFLAAAGTARAGAVTVSVEPPKPAANVLLEDPRAGYDFEEGFANWINAYSNELACVAAPGGGHALLCKVNKHKLRRFVPIGLFRPGRRYALVCRICPTRKVSTRVLAWSGLGCTLTLYDKVWKRTASIRCFGEGPCGVWTRVTSEPTEIPDWVAIASMTVGLNYTPGAGYVDDIELVESDCALGVKVSAPSGIREIKIVDERLTTVFYKAFEKPLPAWEGQVPADAAHHYEVFALDADGDIGVWQQK